MKTWKLLCDFEETDHLDLACNRCGQVARMPTHGSPGVIIIAAIGLGLVTDPAGSAVNPGYMPAAIQCRKCRTIWETKPECVNDVRQAV